jgi:hypothetical protein
MFRVSLPHDETTLLGGWSDRAESLVSAGDLGSTFGQVPDSWSFGAVAALIQDVSPLKEADHHDDHDHEQEQVDQVAAKGGEERS